MEAVEDNSENNKDETKEDAERRKTEENIRWRGWLEDEKVRRENRGKGEGGVAEKIRGRVGGLFTCLWRITKEKRGY